MKAAILAGGRGTRLYPYTEVIPKPLLPLGAHPILEILLLQLSRAGFHDITLCLGHKSQAFKNFLDERRHVIPKNLKIRALVESSPLGTAGAVRQVDFRGRDCLVMNGDVLTDLDWDALADWHRKKKAVLTIASRLEKTRLDLGVMDVDKSHQVTGYREKPRVSNIVSMGIYVYSPKALRFMDKQERIDLPTLVKRLLKKGQRVFRYPSDSLWIHIGTPNQYHRAQKIFARYRARFLPEEVLISHPARSVR